jgi:SNF2 family DNA or RNA helicase
MELLEHQKKALTDSRGLNRVAYYWDMGLGKTFIGAEKLIDLNKEINLVVCQKTKISDWIEHFQQNYPDNFILYDLTDKKQFDNFMFHLEVWNGHSGTLLKIAFINYDLIFRRPDLKNLSGFTLLLDESSLIQNDKAKRSKFILNLHPANVILLSGTPVSGKYENLWSQIHLLGWDISNELYQKQYVNWILTEEDEAGFRHWIVDRENPYKNVDRLKSKLREHGAFFLKTEECFTLPDQTFITVSVPTTKEYRKFRKQKVVEVCNGLETLVGDNVFKERLYSRELCGSYNQKKWDAFNDLLQSTNDRLIVFYNFNKELVGLEMACEMAGKPISIINGQTKDLTAYENESDSVTLIQYQAGAMGLNLQKANKIIYFTLTDKSELFEQSKKRIHRIGQNQPCFYYLMICKNSVEEIMLETLNERRDFTDELFKERCS